MGDTNDGSVRTLVGVGTFSIGQGFLNAYPGLRGNYVVYYGSNGQPPSISRALEDAISSNGLNLIQRDATAPLLTSNNLLYTANRISNLGNSAMVAEVGNILDQYGSNVSNIGVDFSGVAGIGHNSFTFSDGSTFRPDISYTTKSFFSGTINYVDEVKGANVLGATAGNLNQVSNYGQAVAENAAEVGGIRAAGTALEGVGGALIIGGLGYDTYVGATTGDWSGLALNGLGLVALSGGPVAFAAVQGGKVILSPTSSSGPLELLSEANGIPNVSLEALERIGAEESSQSSPVWHACSEYSFP